MIKRWVLNTVNNIEKVKFLSKQLNIHEVLAQLLVKRGIENFEEAKQLFTPDINHLHDPFLMKDMDKAILRIEKAIANHEKILVYGDYDVDGTTSVALVYSFFKKIYPHLNYYIPNRYIEGYGISTEGINYASENGYSLIIALDCGIKSVDKVAYALEKNIDFIICDHHLPGEVIPQASAILDPKRADCNYPFKELSGCGIGFKLIQAYAEKKQFSFDSINQYLDLVAVSIASDIVPIVGENRTLAYFGLKKLNENPCKGLKALINSATKKNELTITDVVFSIGPKINAAGRIDDAKQAVKLLISDCEEHAEDGSFIINNKNTERKNHDADITLQALSILQNSESLRFKKSTVLYQKDWHKGVIGIVASRLIEKHYKPTIIFTYSNGFLTGSARSVKGFDLYQALCECEEFIEQFGGHQYAAGLTIKEENLPLFTSKFEDVVSKNITLEQTQQEIDIDAALNLADIDGKFYRILNRFEPFGPQNMSPIFISKNVKLVGNATIVGEQHLKFSVYQNNSAIFNAIAFNLAEYENQLNSGVNFDICYTIEENCWKEKKSIQLNIKGIKTY